MHSTTSKARRVRRLAFIALAGAILLLTLAAPALAAKAPFDGGPIVADTSTYAANDATVYAMRFSATAGGLNPLAANTTYYVKIRFTTDTASGQPTSGDNRGFVWNATTNQWVQEAHSTWTDFPSVTTDATGAITQSPWFYYKFGDTTKTGDYAVIISLSIGVSGNTLNGTSWVDVTVFDSATSGGWVHPGVDDSANKSKTASVVDFADPSALIAHQRIETNGCDDDNNGIVDDEQYGPVQNGSFDMGVPTDQKLQAQAGAGSADWPDSSGFTLTVPDTDMALGASDAEAPTAPTDLVANVRSSGIQLSWTAATDNEGVAAYNVYRWTDAGAGSGYTAPPVRIATVTDGTAYTDSDATAGTQYQYLVRAVDAATNVGPRSETALPRPLTLHAASTVVNWGRAWTLSGALTTGSDDPIADAAVDLERSVDGGLTWTLDKTLTPEAGTSTYSGNVTGLTMATQYRLVYSGDTGYATSVSNVITVKPRVKLSRPVAPAKVRKSRKFTAYGSLVPTDARGNKAVRIKCYKKVAGHWRLRKTVVARTRNHGSYARYSARLALTSKGAWKLVASYSATAKYAGKTSNARYVRVR